MFMVTSREAISICNAVLNKLMLTAEWEKIRKYCQLKQKVKGPEKSMWTTYMLKLRLFYNSLMILFLCVEGQTTAKNVVAYSFSESRNRVTLPFLNKFVLKTRT